jgi:hypothetical protein
MFWHKLRSLLRRGITRQDALVIARIEVQRRGFQWTEPILIHWGWRSYFIRTNTNWIGGNICVTIRRRDGCVIDVSQSLR